MRSHLSTKALHRAGDVAPINAIQARSFGPQAESTPAVETDAQSQLNTAETMGHDLTTPSPIQAKLTIGAANDPYEQEADRVASQVVQQINAPQTQQPGAVQHEAIHPKDEKKIQPKLAISQPISQLQREAMPEEEDKELQTKSLVQRQDLPEEEEELQTKPLVQRQARPEEEELQAKPAIQRQDLPEEEELQMKPLVQRQEMPEEEEELQAKPAIQRQEMPEEEEELQAKSLVQREELPAEEELQAKPLIQRSADGGGVASTSVESSISAARGKGQPLNEGVRGSMEQAFGADFSGVKVHTGSESDQLNQSVQARAFTTGQDIFFRQGEYQPENRGGQELLAHELTHVVQQSGSRIQSQSFLQTNAPALQCGFPETYAPQETEQQQLVDLVSSECGDISPASLPQINNFLIASHQELSTWESWRNQESWEDSSVSSFMPSIQRLLTATQNFRNTPLNCIGEGTIDAEHTLVREMLTRGTGDVPGLSSADLNLANEWMQYDRNLQNSFQEYFCLAPEGEVEHHYHVRLNLGTGHNDNFFGVGLGAGGSLETPLGEISLGCYPKAGVSGGWVEFSYSNNLGMTWEQSYLQTEGNVQLECAAEISLGPPVSTSFGNDDVCSGSAYPDPHSNWYGPQDFAGATLRNEAGVSGGVGLDASAGVSHLYVVPSTKPGIGFNTSGVCLGLTLGGGSAATADILGIGGQFDVGDTELFHPSLASIGAEPNRTGHGICEDNQLTTLTELLVTRHFYFDTGESDPQQGNRVMENNAAADDILSSLNEALNNYYVVSITLMIAGHASPAWRNAHSLEAAVEENESLAFLRTENTSLFVTSALDQFGEELPPVTIVPSGECVADSPSSGIELSSEGFGSHEGLSETGDPNNDYQRYRRATVRVKIERYIDPLFGGMSIPLDLH